MRLVVNGQPRSVHNHATLVDLLAELDLVPQRVAVEVNRRLVRRADYCRTHLAEDDRIEIVTFVGGG
jgi:thiamine biosynthesis protein ThiS